MGWLKKETAAVEQKVLHLGEDEVEYISRRVAQLVTKEIRIIAVAVLEEVLGQLDPEARVVREDG